MRVTYIRVDISLEVPWRIGTWDTPETDLHTFATSTDGDGVPVVPASGLVGSLASQLDETLRQDLLGGKTILQNDGPEPTFGLTASPWYFLGTTTAAKASDIEERQRTSINRFRAASQGKGLHNVQEVGPQPGEWDVRLYLRSSADPQPMVSALKAWEPTVGGSLTTGLGAARVTSFRHRSFDLTQPSALLELTRNDKVGRDRLDALLDSPKASESPGAKREPALLLSATLTVRNLRASPRPSKYFHGSRWKGLLRSRVEYIGRTLGHDLCGGTLQDRPLSGCGNCSTCRVFGSGATGAGAWIFTCSPMDEPAQQTRKRNAINRFTGGADAHLLFDEVTHAPMTLELQVVERANVEDRDRWTVVALVHALRDLDHGLIGLGGGTTGGLGSSLITHLTIGGAATRQMPDFTSGKQSDFGTAVLVGVPRTENHGNDA